MIITSFIVGVKSEVQNREISLDGEDFDAVKTAMLKTNTKKRSI